MSNSTTRITKLTPLNCDAIAQAQQAVDMDVILTATTAEWPDLTPEQAAAKLREAKVAIPGPFNAHPKASLNAPIRKLVALESETPEPDETKEAPTEAETDTREKLDAEIARLVETQQRVDAKTFDLQAQHDALPDDDPKKDKLHAQLLALLANGTDISKKLQTLRSPQEFERRVNDRIHTTERITKMAKNDTTKKQTAKDLGVPAVYLNDKGTFKAGMDARLKSDLICAILEVDNPGALVKWSKADAEKLFAKYGHWTPFLDRKREILKAKAEAVAAKVEAKAAAAKAKAADKKAKATAKKNGTAASSDTSTGKVEVTPNPKPKPTKKKAGRSSSRTARRSNK